MSLQWADFPSGQPGMYGTDIGRILDGTPWVNNLGSITADPDSVNFPDGAVLRPFSGSSGPTGATRLAVSNPGEEVGVEFRFYVVEMPDNSDGKPFIALNSPGNGAHYVLGIMPNGSLRVYYGTNTIGAGRIVADSSVPLILGNAWNHIGFKANVVTGEYEVRRNGAPVAALTGVDEDAPGVGNTIGIVAFPQNHAGRGLGNFSAYKDIIVWTPEGTEFNDFQGTVQVYDMTPDADVDLGTWTLSSGTEAFALMDEAPPNDTGYVYAGEPPQDPLSVGLSDLPADVTSVRALIMIARGFNSDSGDGALQMAITPNGGVDTDTGIEHVMTTTPTYYWDVSEISPVTAARWTPTEANNLTLSFDRTL